MHQNGSFQNLCPSELPSHMSPQAQESRLLLNLNSRPSTPPRMPRTRFWPREVTFARTIINNPHISITALTTYRGESPDEGPSEISGKYVRTERCKIIPAKLIVFLPIFPKMAGWQARGPSVQRKVLKNSH